MHLGSSESTQEARVALGYCLEQLLGADYKANFSPVSRAEISPRPPEQIFLKRRLRLHGENVSTS